MDKNFTRMYWASLKAAAKASPWLAAGIIIFISILIVLNVEGRSGSGPLLLGLSKSSLLAISGSILASSLFWVVNRVIHLLDTSQKSVVNDYFKHTHDEFGLKHIFDQRGGQDILNLYKELLTKAERRIWAIGMTNQSFTQQHLPIILQRCEHISGIEVKLLFWNPNAKIVVKDFPPTHIHEIQTKLEHKANSETNWISKVDGYLNSLKSQISAYGELKGRIDIYYITMPTNISCLVVDDDIFFFPFLSRGSSNLDPHMHFDATRGIGKIIVEHYDEVLKSTEYCEIQ
ncbi:hypothetical protein [Thalassolituus oleivorans]|uniref:hypothetical protein n=1 Tax=Thalassolituus oleivorans TaxID=187493 RepID=UPI001CE388AB|nr:hypothetical protein [Thalassolituus oleivorans]MCA6128689.1 hypothetical protein [Thalassolituus oleivorans 4BN06-13]